MVIVSGGIFWILPDLKEEMNMSKKENQKENGKRNRIYICLTFVCTICLIVVLGIMLKDYIREQKNQEYYEKLAEENAKEVPHEAEIIEREDQESEFLTLLGITIPEKNINWEELYQENEDIYAWIYIPGTMIDYPIVQHPTDNEYYVNHNLDGSKGRPAAIMTHTYNKKDFTDKNTVVYGHNMRNGSMFQNLHNFIDKEFFSENKYVYIYLPDQVYVYEVFAAYTFTNELIPVAYDFSSEKGFEAYLDTVFSYKGKNGLFRDGINITAENHLLTLSTCTTPTDYNYRYLVQGVLVNDPTLTEDQIIRTIQSIQ